MTRATTMLWVAAAFLNGASDILVGVQGIGKPSWHVIDGIVFIILGARVAWRELR